MNLRFLSLFSGLEGASLAWTPLGWECVAVAEVDKNACKVLAARHPNVPNLGDVTQITEDRVKALGHVDVVVFGSPCQDMSLAGKRQGLRHEDGSHTRSGLFHHGLQIAKWSNARFILWENVKGAFSSNKGADFACVVGQMAGIAGVRAPENGWGTEGVALGDAGLVEWCCLDSAWRGVPQRRERVFALLDTGDWASRPPVLVVTDSLPRTPPPRRKTRQEVAGRAAESLGGCGEGSPTEDATGRHVLSYGFSAGNSSQSFGIAFTEEATPPLRAAESGTNQMPTILTAAFGIDGEVNCSEEIMGTLKSLSHNSGGRQEAVCYAIHPHSIGRKPEAGPQRGDWSDSGVGYTLDTVGTQAVCYPESETFNVSMPLPKYAIRKITPVEAARLQGVPDDYLDIPGLSDTAKYKLLGNGFAIPVIRYIGEQIEAALAYQIADDSSF